MLIVVAEFFVELIKNPQIKFAKDHALIQSLSRVVVRDNYTRDVIGRNASQYDPESAYISSESANIVRTQSFNSYYSPYVPVRSGVEGIIRNLNVTSLTNPNYLSIILKTPGLGEFDTIDNKKINPYLRCFWIDLLKTVIMIRSINFRINVSRMVCILCRFNKFRLSDNYCPRIIVIVRCHSLSPLFNKN
jgi:hypothetical protein